MNKLRISVAGAGLIGKTHIKLVAESDQCELASIVDPSAGAIDVAEQYGVPVFDSLRLCLLKISPMALFWRHQTSCMLSRRINVST